MGESVERQTLYPLVRKEATVFQICHSLCIAIPRKIVKELGLKKGDKVTVELSLTPNFEKIIVIRRCSDGGSQATANT